MRFNESTLACKSSIYLNVRQHRPRNIHCPRTICMLHLTATAFMETCKCAAQQPRTLKPSLKVYTPPGKFRSGSKDLLQPVRSHSVSYGDRAFSIIAPHLWNNLPLDIRTSKSVSAFKTKTIVNLVSCRVSLIFYCMSSRISWRQVGFLSHSADFLRPPSSVQHDSLVSSLYYFSFTAKPFQWVSKPCVTVGNIH